MARSMAAKVDTSIVVLEAAKKMLRQNGYSKLSTRDVAAAAGVPLSQIHALQLLTKRVLMRGVQGRGGTNYLSYQLNVVLKDKTRVTVVDHAGLEASREDAKKLAEFLSVPLWDTAKGETDLLPSGASKLDTWIAKKVDEVDRDRKD